LGTGPNSSHPKVISNDTSATQSPIGRIELDYEYFYQLYPGNQTVSSPDTNQTTAPPVNRTVAKRRRTATATTTTSANFEYTLSSTSKSPESGSVTSAYGSASVTVNPGPSYSPASSTQFGANVIKLSTIAIDKFS
jgi:hypothetical protein